MKVAMNQQGGGRRDGFGQGRSGFGQGREGFGRNREGRGAGRFGRGAGRTGYRNQWVRQGEGPGEANKIAQYEEEQKQELVKKDSQEDGKWMEAKKDDGNQQTSRGNKIDDNKGAGSEVIKSGNSKNSEKGESSGANTQSAKIPCSHCGFYNHASVDCRRKHLVTNEGSGSKKDRIPCSFCGLYNHDLADCRRQNRSVNDGVSKLCNICGLAGHISSCCRWQGCDICGDSDHNAYECQRCLPWNLGPELCATQVEGQSFLFIDEYIDPRVTKEKASTTVITVKQGSVTPRQIELEFASLTGNGMWKWRVKQIADNRFLMRFPTVAMANQWSHIKNLTMTKILP